jgi:hypothetical protein
MRAAARDMTARGGRLSPSARQAAMTTRNRAVIVPQQAHDSMCRATDRLRAGESSPSR